MATNSRVAAALKSVVKPKTKKAWASNQNAPQSKSYKPAKDKQVAAKPVGWRWTNAGAERLGVSAAKKPTLADIEKYKDKVFKKGGQEHRYIYTEARADKSDVNRKDKFESGGSIKTGDFVTVNGRKTKILEAYNDKAFGDKTVYKVNVPMYPNIKNSPMTKSIYIKDETSGALRKVERSDYVDIKKDGGQTYHKSQNPPQSKSYKEEDDKKVPAKPVGWRWTSYGAKKVGEDDSKKPSIEDIEKYKNKTFKLRGQSVRYLYPERRVDKSDVNRRRKFEEGGEMDSFARGGTPQAAPQSDVYDESRDKMHHAKPVGWRFKTSYANRRGIDPYSKPTTEQIEKGKGVYWENRADKSDRNHRRRFEGGGENLQPNLLESSDVTVQENEQPKMLRATEFTVEEFEPKLRISSVDVTVHEDSYEEGELGYVNSYSLPEHVGESMTGAEVIPYLKDKLYLSDKAEDYVVMDNSIRYDMLQDGDGNEADESDKELWKQGKKKLYNAHYVISFDGVIEFEVNEETLSSETGIGVYRVGGVTQSGVQSKSYTEDADKRVHAKPVGWRFKTRFARRKGIDPYRKPTLEEIEKWKDKGVYYEVRFDKSDRNYKKRFGKGGNIRTSFKVGSKVELSEAGWDNENYHSFFDGKDDVQLEVTHVYKSTSQHQGYDSGIGEALYSTKRVDTGESVPFDLYDYELQRSHVSKKEDGGDIEGGETNENMLKNQAKNISHHAAELHTILQSKTEVAPWVIAKAQRASTDLADITHFLDGNTQEPADSFARGGVPKISNRDAKEYTENKLEFKGANLEGKKMENGDYVVLSYGYYPIWFFSAATSKWYGNKNGFSMTTKKQISQSRPTYTADMLSKSELEDVMHRSSLGSLYEEEIAEDNEPNV